jgi:phosphonate transport system substrate-binding protein
LGEDEGYFGSAIESGAHQTSLRMILDRMVDASAIDSTVLEAELRRYPAFESEIRILDAIGPSPMPPWVVHKSVPGELRAALTDVLTGMHIDADGRRILDQWGISHFATTGHASYRPIREMALAADRVRL